LGGWEAELFRWDVVGAGLPLAFGAFSRKNDAA